MAALSAGEVFVNLVVRGGAIKPALAQAQEQVKRFGTTISAISVATGNLISSLVMKAISKVTDAKQFLWDKAKLDPRTAIGILEYQRNIDKMRDSLAKSANIIIQAMLPAMNLSAKGFVIMAGYIEDLVAWLDEMGVVAALQAGDFSAAFDIAWKEFQAIWLSGSQAILGQWREFSNGILDIWDIVSKEIVSVFGQALAKIGTMLNVVMGGLRMAAPKELVDNLSILNDVADMFTMAGEGFERTGQKMNKEIASRIDARNAQAKEEQRILQEQIDALREQAAQQTEVVKQKRNIQRAENEARFSEVMAGRASAAASGISGTFALGVSGGNVMYQTQKDMLREMREQKELQRKQLEELKKNKGPVFTP
jgi:hypothetical protein